jgi:hypothetical protein
MRKPSLKDAVALLDLPNWEHVGALLLSHGITDGDQESCELCPIAQFLLTVARLRYVSVGATMAFPHWVNARGGVELPPAAVDFIRWFDDFGRV